MGFVLSSTAVVMQVLDERGDTATPHGQKMVSILLLEDLAIVPLLARRGLLCAGARRHGDRRWIKRGHRRGVASPAWSLPACWLLNPLFRVLAAANAREVMTAAALLVVLGAALLMQLGGLSMAMGAFLAGVLLSESTFRHQLEADIEPFRGILLGLFFLSVGMSLDLAVIAREWPIIVAGVLAFMVVKALGIYAVARALQGHPRRGALPRGAVRAGRRVRLRAVRGRRRGRHHHGGQQRHLHGHRHPVDGADAAHRAARCNGCCRRPSSRSTASTRPTA